MQGNRITGLRIIFTTTLAHTLATCVFIFLAFFYTKFTGKEAWPILGPDLLTAFALETLLIFLLLRLRRGTRFLFEMSFSVLVSWVVGLASFLTLDTFAQALFIKPPVFSWLVSLAVLSIIVNRFEKNTP